MSSPEDQALAALAADRLLVDLQTLVRIPSVTGSERPAAEFVVSRAGELGLHGGLEQEDLTALRADPGYPGEEIARDELVNARVRLAGTGEERLALCGHLDVVDPRGARPWTHGDPFSGVIEDGRLFGRGTADMKAGVIAALHAMAAARSAGVPTAPVDLLAVSSEEDGGLGAFAALRRDAGYAGCVIPEPTGFDVVCAQAGAITFKGVVRGRSAHAAHRKRGVSAIDRYLPIHEALAEYERTVNASVAHPLMSALDLPYPVLVGRLNAGTWSSQVPDSLEFEGRAPVRVGESVDETRSAIERVVAGAAPGTELDWSGGSYAPCEVDTGDPLVATMSAAATDELGRDVQRVGVPWGADMRLFVQAGIPTVMCGPRGIEGAHAVDESVACEDVVAVARILVRAICRFGQAA